MDDSTEQPTEDANLLQPTSVEKPASTDTQQTPAIAWTASEFLVHEKSSGWYIVLALAALAVAVLVFIVTRDVVSVGVVILSAIILGVYAGHEPRQLEYSVDGGGLSVDGKRYRYDTFRSFSVIPEGAFSSIVFMPHRRFALPVTIYYAPDDEQKIISLLSGHLPLDERKRDAVDRLMHRIRF